MRRLIGAAIAASLPALAHAQTVPALQATAAATASASATAPASSAPSDAAARVASAPATMPPPINPLSPSAHLDAKEKQAVALARHWAARPIMPHPGPDGVVRFLYGATMPTVVCAPLESCDLALQPGEIVNNVALGDKVRWSVMPEISGAGETLTTHISIKPHDAGLVTSLTVYTTRRTYAVKLLSTQTQWMPLVGFNYPDDQERAWSSYAQTVAFSAAAHASSHVGAGDLQFYKISGDNPAWRPVRAYTDGQKTYVEFPRAMRFSAAPALVALTGGGIFSAPETQMVNYRMRGDRYIADRVLDRAALISGVGGGQERVVIERERGR